MNGSWKEKNGEKKIKMNQSSEQVVVLVKNREDDKQSRYLLLKKGSIMSFRFLKKEPLNVKQWR